MILQPLLIKQLITTVIAPHGMTDLIHAKLYNTTDTLYTINSVNFGATLLLESAHVPYVMDIAFIISSIIHFRHDMPTFKSVDPMWISAIFVALTVTFQVDLFMAFMVAVHVPNHYKMNWKFIETDVPNNVALLLLSTLVFSQFTGLPDDILFSPFLMDISKGFIISHILYEETCIHSPKKLQ